jgi:hypothetical protein
MIDEGKVGGGGYFSIRCVNVFSALSVVNENYIEEEEEGASSDVLSNTSTLVGPEADAERETSV